MDDQYFDGLIKAMTRAESSRRAVVGLLLGGVLGNTLQGVQVADAKKRKNKKNKKKNKNKNTQNQPPPVPPPPPPPPPPQTGTVGCDPSLTVSVEDSRVFAQTFVAPSNGHVTQAEVTLLVNPADFSLTFGIHIVDGQGVPIFPPVRTAVVENIDETTADAPRLVSATFANPAALVEGERFGLSITGPEDVAYEALANNNGAACPDGFLFADSDDDGEFEDFPNLDLVWAITFEI